MRVTTSPEALIGVPTFGTAPFLDLWRGRTGSATFLVSNRTTYDVLVGLAARHVDPRLGVSLTPPAPGNLIGSGARGECTVIAEPRRGIRPGIYLVEATVIAKGPAFTAEIGVNIPVRVSNRPPRACDDEAVTSRDQPVTIRVLDNDSDPDASAPGPLLVLAGPPGAGGAVVSVDVDGAVTYTPGPGWVGVDHFQYTITDADGDRASGTVTVTVSGP